MSDAALPYPNIQPFTAFTGDIGSGATEELLSTPLTGTFWSIQMLVVTFYCDPTVLTAGCKLALYDGTEFLSTMIRLGITDLAPEFPNLNFTFETPFPSFYGMKLTMNGEAGSSLCSANAFGFLDTWYPG
jgi:hypothetical protein